MKAIQRQIGPVLVSAIISVGYFLAVWQLFLVKSDLQPNVFQLLNILFGALTISFGQVCNYWLGSSAGSKTKDTILADAVAKP